MFGIGAPEISILLFIFAWFVIPGIIGATIAGRRGRSRFLWFILSAVIPILLFVPLFLRPARPVRGRYKECPYCAEIILERATVCKHCHKDLSLSL